MKGKTGRIGPDGAVKIPGDCLESVGLHPGEEVEFRPVGKGLLIEPVEAVARMKKGSKDALDAITGALPLPVELIDELVENEYLYEPQEVD